MRIVLWAAVLLAVFTLWSTDLIAEDVYTLENMTIMGRPETSAEQNLTTIDIKNQSPESGVPGVLDQTSGIDVQKRSILTPKNSQVKIRGMDERRSLIMLDGRPLNGTGVMGGHFVDWSELATDNWQAVDVSKGAFSAMYGNTLGGYIDLVPAPLGEDPTATVRMGVKRYGTCFVDASASARNDFIGGKFTAGYIETDGNLRNSQAERANASGKIHYYWGDDGKVTASFRYTDGKYGMPVKNQAGMDGYDSDYPESLASLLIGPGIKLSGGNTFGDDSCYTKERTEIDLSMTRTVFGVASEIKIYSNKENREDTLYSYSDGEKMLVRESSPDKSWGWVGRFKKQMTDHRIGFGADGNYQGYDGTDITYVREEYFKSTPTDGADESDATRWQGAYVDDLWVISDKLSVYAGLRYEDYYGDRQVDQVTGYAGGMTTETVNAGFDEDVLLPKAGLEFCPVTGLSLFGRFARSTRFPDNPAFYWYYGGYRPEVDPSSDVVRKKLTYEDALQYEAGITFTGLPSLRASLSYYAYEVDDYIRWIFGYRPSRVVYNVDKVSFTGVELDVEGRILDNLSAFFNFTWQETKKKGDVLDASNVLSDCLSELPEYKFNAGIKYSRGDGMEAKATVHWVDDRQVPFLNGKSSSEGTALGTDVTLQTLDAYTVVDLSLRYPLWKKHATGFVTVGVENLFNERYEEEYGYPNPGQTFYIGLELKI